MPIHIYTKDPRGVLATFRELCRDGKVRTWERIGKNTYGFLARQYAGRARIQFNEEEDCLVGNVYFPEDTEVNTFIYAVYAANCAQSFIAHFQGVVTRVSISAKRGTTEKALDEI